MDTNRRGFLKSIGAFGVVTAVPTTVAAAMCLEKNDIFAELIKLEVVHVGFKGLDTYTSSQFKEVSPNTFYLVPRSTYIVPHEKIDDRILVKLKSRNNSNSDVIFIILSGVGDFLKTACFDVVDSDFDISSFYNRLTNSTKAAIRLAMEDVGMHDIEGYLTDIKELCHAWVSARFEKARKCVLS